MAVLNSKPFAFQSTRYRPENAYWMAQMSKAAYEKTAQGAPDSNAIKEKLQALDADFKAVDGFDAKSSQGIVVRHEHYIVAAFRGTDEPADWLDNINALSMEGPIGRVHNGFQKALMDIWPGMKSRIRAHRRDAVGRHLPLWLTGHSLGGAMATLAAAELIQADEPFFGVYTYGQPRVGDRGFARVFNVEAKSRFFRFQNNNDIVTRVPARLMNYSHVGSFVYISAEMQLSWDIGRWYQFLDAVKGAIDDIGDIGLDGVKDHNIDKYIQGIDQWGDKPPED